MKITDQTNRDGVQFYALCQGDVFKYAGEAYMKIDCNIINNLGYEQNAFSFRTSNVVFIPKNAIVVKVNAELIIT